MAKPVVPDFSEFPPGTVTEYTTLVCLACIFDIFTKQIGLAPRSAYSEIKRYMPTVEELTSRKAVRPFFDSEEKHRSEEHTSELQSRLHLVCRLLLVKKKLRSSKYSAKPCFA